MLVYNLSIIDQLYIASALSMRQFQDSIPFLSSSKCILRIHVCRYVWSLDSRSNNSCTPIIQEPDAIVWFRLVLGKWFKGSCFLIKLDRHWIRKKLQTKHRSLWSWCTTMHRSFHLLSCIDVYVMHSNWAIRSRAFHCRRMDSLISVAVTKIWL